MKLALAGALSLALVSPSVACDTLPAVIQMLTQHGADFSVLDPNKADHFVSALESQHGIQYPAVTNVLIAAFPQGLVYGLEMKGCLTRPILFATASPLTPAKLSGRQPSGLVFA